MVQHFLNDPNHDFVKDGPLAMHAKASVLLGEAAAVAALYVAGMLLPSASVPLNHF